MASKKQKLSDLPEERVDLLTGHRFAIVKVEAEGWMITDADNRTKIPIGPFDNLEERLLTLAKELVTIANHRVRRYDGLLNAIESWTRVLYFLEDVFPGMLTSDALQSLIDLDACAHDLAVRRMSGLITGRSALFDGGYRWLESYEIAKAEGSEPRTPSSRAIRTYQDRIEGRITLVWFALREALPAEQVPTTMATLLKSAGIRNCDDQLDSPITAENVALWFASVNEDNRALGRTYCYEAAKEKFKDQLEACKGRSEEAIAFAREQLEWIRCRQPINRPIPVDDDKGSNRVVRTGPRTTARGK